MAGASSARAYSSIEVLCIPVARYSTPCSSHLPLFTGLLK